MIGNGWREQEAWLRSKPPLAGKTTFLDNAPTMGMTARPRSLAGKLEFRLISIGMSVFAYLLEKMILRSAKGGRTNP
ncbi:MAG: hypothetical protein HP495_09765 [Nitrospira sp.]|nr:hypothetical protein [Nitrospira sp.]